MIIEGSLNSLELYSEKSVNKYSKCFHSRIPKEGGRQISIRNPIPGPTAQRLSPPPLSGTKRSTRSQAPVATPKSESMAVLRAPPPSFLPHPPLSRPSHSQSKRRRPTTCRGVAATGPAHSSSRSRSGGGGVHGGRAKNGLLLAAARRRRPREEERVLPCLRATEAGVGAAGVAREEDEYGDEYLATEAGWGVRRMARVGEEMRRVAQVQAQAFHVPVALFDDFFFDFFKVSTCMSCCLRVNLMDLFVLVV